MILLWSMTLIPLLLGLFFWISNKKVVLLEWALAVIAGVITCGVFQAVLILGMTADVETWSGRVTLARYDPAYVEWYMHAVYRTEHYTTTDSNGDVSHHTREVFDHYERRTRTVPPSWLAKDSLGQNRSISPEVFEDIAAKFKCRRQEKGHKGNYDSGDPYTYFAEPTSGYVYPTTATKMWSNRVKAAPSTFSFRKVPEGTKGIYPWPEPANWIGTTARLRGTAVDMGSVAWDQLNAELGAAKKINLIAIGFGEAADRGVALTQEAAWVGGKKNDLVLCFGGGTRQKPEWSHVFGWTESTLVKRNLEAMLLDGPITPALLPKIRDEVVANYVIKNWHKFDYLTIEPPGWSYMVLIVVMGLTQAAVWFVALHNNISKRG